MNSMKKVLALVMVCLMVVSLIPMSAFAEHDAQWTETTETRQISENEEEDVTVHYCEDDECANAETPAHSAHDAEWNPETGKCTVCEFEHDHTDNWDSATGTCNECGFAHAEHDWKNENAECTVCEYSHVHDWSDANGVCKVCEFECTHDACSIVDENEHKCSTCGKTLAHDFVDGKCSKCEYECPHTEFEQKSSDDNENHVCKACGKEFPHEFEQVEGDDTNRKCKDCDATEEQNDADENGVSEASGFALNSPADEHKWGVDETTNKHKCSVDGCTEHTEHDADWNSENGKCTVCELAHDHTDNWENGKCTVCGFECQHDYAADESDKKVHKCTICSVTEKHNTLGTGGSCSVCGKTPVAELYVKGGTPEYTYYYSLQDAIDDVTVDGTVDISDINEYCSKPIPTAKSTVTLLEDVAENIVIYKPDITAGFVVIGKGHSSGTITVNAGTVELRGFNQAGDITVNSPATAFITSGIYGEHKGDGEYIISGSNTVDAPSDYPIFKNAVKTSECYAYWKRNETRTDYTRADSFTRYIPNGYSVKVFKPSITSLSANYIYYRNSTQYSPTYLVIYTDGNYEDLVQDGDVFKCLKIGSVAYDEYGNSGSTQYYTVKSDDNGKAVITINSNGIKKWFNYSGTRQVSVQFVTGVTETKEIKVGSTVKTGDASNIALWAGIMAASLVIVGCGAYIVIRKSRKK